MMEDIGLFKQGWKWLQSQKHIYSRARTATGHCRDKIGIAIEKHWPMVCNGCAKFGRFLCFVFLYWRDSVIRGFHSFIGLGSAALLLIMWSCFLSLTSMSCLVYVLLSMVCFFFFFPNIIFDLHFADPFHLIVSLGIYVIFLFYVLETFS